MVVLSDCFANEFTSKKLDNVQLMTSVSSEFGYNLIYKLGANESYVMII